MDKLSRIYYPQCWDINSPIDIDEADISFWLQSATPLTHSQSRNAMDLRSYIFLLLLARTNSTYTNDHRPWSPYPNSSRVLQCRAAAPNNLGDYTISSWRHFKGDHYIHGDIQFDFSDSRLSAIDEKLDLYDYVITGTDTLNFVSCYSQSVLSFQDFLRPFQIEAWIGISVTIGSLAILLHAILKFVASLNRLIALDRYTLLPYLVMLASIWEQAVPLPKFLRDKFATRIVSGLWFLAIVIICNSFKGLAITGITSPLPETGVDYFNNLTDRRVGLVYDYPKVRIDNLWDSALGANDFTIFSSRGIHLTNKNLFSTFIFHLRMALENIIWEDQARGKTCFSVKDYPLVSFTCFKN